MAATAESRSAKSETLPLIEVETSGLPRWFSSRGCVIERGDTYEVFVGGTLVGTFDGDRTFERNALLVQLAEDARCHLGKLADAFGVSDEWLRRLRRRYESGGLDALRPKDGGGVPILSERDRARLEKMFEQGLRPPAAHAKLKRASLSTIARAYRAWRARRDAPAASTPALAATERTLALPGIEMLPTTSTAADDIPALPPEVVRGGPFVQHIGVWLMVAMVARMGLHELARKAAGERLAEQTLRVALDAAIATFSLGEPTLEGARRLRTPTAALLLQAPVAPSPDTLRATMDDLAADLGGVFLHVGMLRAYLEADRRAESERAVFYIDNHMRPYTGKHVVRKGWRMQDKRVRPGVTDYYLHDEDGRPLFRIDVASHDSLPVWLMPFVINIRPIVGDDEPVLLAFDRGGAFPEIMAALRDEGCEFVTYERAPYPKLPQTAFTTELAFDDETVRFVESRINLKKGRGRVRRISVLGEDGRQINLLASSSADAERLIAIMRGRWRQENAFKHGKERWGINHLDARKTHPVDPNDIVPNPARRRLDIARRATHVREGDARCDLVRFPEGHPRHERALRDIDAALKTEREIDALRPTLPKHARVADTDLAGKLVRHDGRRKLVLDTIRIACANAEADLAQLLAAHLAKPREAKHVVANILRAPGKVRVGESTITVDSAPSGSDAGRGPPRITALRRGSGRPARSPSTRRSPCRSSRRRRCTRSRRRCSFRPCTCTGGSRTCSRSPSRSARTDRPCTCRCRSARPACRACRCSSRRT
jgi:hypothetical protein